MALVQDHGSGGLHAAPPDPGRQSPGDSLCQSAPRAASAPARAPRRRAAARLAGRSRATVASGCPSPPSIKTPRGTLVAPRPHGHLFALDARDRHPWEIKYHLHLLPALTHLLEVHRLPPLPDRFRIHDSPSDETLRELVQELKPQLAEVWSVRGRGTVEPSSILSADVEVAARSFPLRFLALGPPQRRKIHLIHSLHSVSRCDHCGRFYKNQHECSTRRRDFYFHHIHAQSSQWWQPIKFFPLGSHPRTERLFLTYDVETYTWMGAFGKQLVPFLLVMKITGEPALVRLGLNLARELGWDAWREHADTFFCLNPQKQAIGRKFREFRDRLQLLLVDHIWQDFVERNPVEDWSRTEHGVEPRELTFQQLEKCPLLRGAPRFIEFYVVGHNINGFDEILLAAQVINNRSEVPGPFRISRNFMPRCGKILFNDVTYSLPNPRHKKRTDYSDWERGMCDDRDFKYQFVKVMVRDTFALTHTSLRKAALAYSLPVEKGCCPYQAVNQFYMLGSYRGDEDGFPLQEYWKDREEYLFNRDLWKEKKEERYDIVRETLDYCALDVLVTASLVEKLQESYAHFIGEAVGLPDARFNIFQRPTISSNSHAIFRQILFRDEKPRRAHLSRHLLAPSHELYDYVRASIRGGRCYPTYLGVLEEPLYVYDICGMYASALTHPMPWGAPLSPYERALAVRDWEAALRRPGHQIDYFDKHLLPAIFTIDADPPDERLLDPLPPFCSRKGGRLCWTNEPLRGEVATSIDVITLHNRGWSVRLVPDERTAVFPGWKCVAREYVQLNIAAKEKADREKNQTQRSIAKLLSNALYGSFATKLDNRQIVFSDQMGPEQLKGISTGALAIKSSSYIETDNLSAQVMPAFTRVYVPQQLAFGDSEPEESDEEGGNAPFYTPAEGQDHVTYTYKPITFLEADEGDMCLHTLEKTDPLIDNDRYPSHIASFVLAWTRAFMSEWCEFLYAEDRGTPLEQRALTSVYGDTDSLFVTERGHRLMETRGRKRIKKNGGRLVFDPKDPQLTWLVECETVCANCGGDAYSPESVFLAPKLYALKCLLCSNCGHVSKGKLRAKGHAAESLDYELMVRCYLADLQGDEKQRFATSRLSLKRTLASAQPGAHPFTVTETTLKRTLRPWRDRTLAQLDAHRLIPYSQSRPNPRNEEVCWIEMP
ncbi:DNA polymerase [Simian adenovirus 48]|uniref:DNA polymerase n=2 Tax=Mastadenovirus TaxID=10509 RepID=A0A9W3I4L2_9ADEN|nr:DNA polymerase [Simian adenovirus 48]